MATTSMIPRCRASTNAARSWAERNGGYILKLGSRVSSGALVEGEVVRRDFGGHPQPALLRGGEDIDVSSEETCWQWYLAPVCAASSISRATTSDSAEAGIPLTP